MNDADWVAAETLEDATKCLADTIANGIVDDDFIEEYIDTPFELDSVAMDTMTFVHEDEINGPRTSFKDELESRIKNGDKFPQFFASSEY